MKKIRIGEQGKKRPIVVLRPSLRQIESKIKINSRKLRRVQQNAKGVDVAAEQFYKEKIQSYRQYLKEVTKQTT